MTARTAERPVAGRLLGIAPGLSIGPALAGEDILAAALTVIAEAPPRHFATPWGKEMSVAITSCGDQGWIADRRGYRYSPTDPATGLPWPPMPSLLQDFAARTAHAAGFPRFAPDSCLINDYGPAARMALHQDKDEQDFDQPIVSVSFGRAASFRWGGAQRRAPSRAFRLQHGDTLVFGGPARLMFHGLDRLLGPPHPQLGDRRINLTFRRS